jgi:large subunit ribosomal protein L24
MRVLRDQYRVVVSGLMMRTRHQKPSQKNPGGIVREEGSIHASNVMIVDPKTDRPTRVGVKTNNAGKRVRVAKRSGTILEK